MEPTVEENLSWENIASKGKKPSWGIGLRVDSQVSTSEQRGRAERHVERGTLVV